MSYNNKKSATYITVDGGDGAGKSTFIKNLNNFFTSINKRVLLTKEFGSEHDLFCQKSREIALSSVYNVDELAGQIAFAAIARQHQQLVIKPAINSGNFDIILSDRGIDSNYAYGPEHIKPQGMKSKIINDLFKIAYLDAVAPSITFYLDAEPELSEKRRAGRTPESFLNNGVDRIEKKGSSFQVKVRKNFLSLAKKNPDRIKVIKITEGMTPQDVLNSAISILNENNLI
jgi:dTMP kinase